MTPPDDKQPWLVSLRQPATVKILGELKRVWAVEATIASSSRCSRCQDAMEFRSWSEHCAK